MGTANFQWDDRFTVAERASIALLFDRLARNAIAPLMLYCVDHNGFPLVVFNGRFSEPTVEHIGAELTELFAEAPENQPR